VVFQFRTGGKTNLRLLTILPNRRYFRNDQETIAC